MIEVPPTLILDYVGRSAKIYPLKNKAELREVPLFCNPATLVQLQLQTGENYISVHYNRRLVTHITPIHHITSH